MKEPEVFRLNDKANDSVTPMENDRMLSGIGSVRILLTATNTDEIINI